MTKPKKVRITITTLDGDLLDAFEVSHWKTETDAEDLENQGRVVFSQARVGSHASNALLCERISRYVWGPK